MTDKQKTIERFIDDQLKGSDDIFLVELKVLPGNNIKVFLDADNGITIDKCIKINRALYKQIEESELFPNGDFSMEVSSPGVDEPLKLRRQYTKNIGRTVEVMMNDGSRKEGKLKEVNEDEMVIEEKPQGKKKADSIEKTTNILFNQVKHTKVLVTF
jgi:ribosome maturation factor RimP